jgi:hypothetical protein
MYTYGDSLKLKNKHAPAGMFPNDNPHLDKEGKKGRKEVLRARPYFAGREAIANTSGLIGRFPQKLQDKTGLKGTGTANTTSPGAVRRLFTYLPAGILPRRGSGRPGGGN